MKHLDAKLITAGLLMPYDIVIQEKDGSYHEKFCGITDRVTAALLEAYEAGRRDEGEEACSLIAIYVGEKESMPATAEHICSKLRARSSKGGNNE